MLVILQRELVREARRRDAFWTRMATSALGFVVCLFLLFAMGSAADGRRIFFVLSFAAFGFCLIQGLRVAAGAIADEKRDGTLPLLLLTPFRPTGLVIGKFLAVGIPLVQPCFAFTPVL